MKIKLNIFIISGFLFLLFGCFTSLRAQDGPIAGGYSETDTADEGVVAAANFAVKKRSQTTNSNFTLVSIRTAKIQTVAGVNYQLCLQISTKRKSKKPSEQFVRVVIYRNLKNAYTLTSWTTLKDSSGC